MNHETTKNDGYTLLEMVAVTTILSIVGLVAWFVVIESMKVYAHTYPAIHAGYQARLASERMKRDIRDMKDTASIAVLSPTVLSFADALDQPIAFKLSGGDLFRNDDLLAQGLTSFAFTYWTRDGQAATAPSELWLVEIDLTAQVANRDFRARTVAFPRCLGP